MHQVDARERDVATHGDLDQLRADIAELRQEMQVGFATLETRFERRVGDLIKWSFVFWVGAVGATAPPRRASRHNGASPATQGPRALRWPQTGALNFQR